MTVGIIGAGALGTSVARALGAANVPTIISNSRGPETLADLARDLGSSVTAGTTEEAAQADIVIVAVRWVDVENVLSPLSAWNNRIVIDATNRVQQFGPNGERLGTFGQRGIGLGQFINPTGVSVDCSRCAVRWFNCALVGEAWVISRW